MVSDFWIETFLFVFFVYILSHCISLTLLLVLFLSGKEDGKNLKVETFEKPMNKFKKGRQNT